MRKWVALLVATVGPGCGGSSATPADAASFLGTYTSDVTEVETCAGSQHTTSLVGTVVIAQGGNSGLIVTQPPNGCNLSWSVAGQTATIVTGQSCTVPGSVGGTWTPTFVAGTLVLATSVVTVADHGTATLLLNGATTACTFTQAGTFTRVP